MPVNKYRQALLDSGVKNLKEYGYPNVTADNILTDTIYAAFFLPMLQGSKGHGKNIDAAIERLIVEVNHTLNA